jgi:hypothetical protein
MLDDERRDLPPLLVGLSRPPLPAPDLGGRVDHGERHHDAAQGRNLTGLRHTPPGRLAAGSCTARRWARSGSMILGASRASPLQSESQTGDPRPHSLIKPDHRVD